MYVAVATLADDDDDDCDCDDGGDDNAIDADDTTRRFLAVADDAVAVAVVVGYKEGLKSAIESML